MFAPLIVLSSVLRVYTVVYVMFHFIQIVGNSAKFII